MIQSSHQLYCAPSFSPVTHSHSQTHTNAGYVASALFKPNPSTPSKKKTQKTCLQRRPDSAAPNIWMTAHKPLNEPPETLCRRCPRFKRYASRSRCRGKQVSSSPSLPVSSQAEGTPSYPHPSGASASLLPPPLANPPATDTEAEDTASKPGDCEILPSSALPCAAPFEFKLLLEVSVSGSAAGFGCAEAGVGSVGTCPNNEGAGASSGDGLLPLRLSAVLGAAWPSSDLGGHLSSSSEGFAAATPAGALTLILHQKYVEP